MDIDQLKMQLRREVLLHRDAVDSKSRKLRSDAVCDHLLQALEQAAAGDKTASSDFPFTIAVYCAMRSEVDLDRLVRGAYGRGWRVAFPCMMKRPGASLRTFAHRSNQIMQFRIVSRESYEAESAEFLNHPLKSYEPHDAELEGSRSCPPEQIDAIAVPMVAFDDENHRLGYGGGNYDEFLPKLRAGVFVAGVAFDEQHVDSVPVDEHDVTLPRIFTA